MRGTSEASAREGHKGKSVVLPQDSYLAAFKKIWRLITALVAVMQDAYHTETNYRLYSHLRTNIILPSPPSVFPLCPPLPFLPPLSHLSDVRRKRHVPVPGEYLHAPVVLPCLHGGLLLHAQTLLGWGGEEGGERLGRVGGVWGGVGGGDLTTICHVNNGI